MAFLQLFYSLPEDWLKLLTLRLLHVAVEVRGCPHRDGGGAPNAAVKRLLPAAAVELLVVPLSLLIAALMVLDITKAAGGLVLHWLLLRHGCQVRRRHLLVDSLELVFLRVHGHRVVWERGWTSI